MANFKELYDTISLFRTTNESGNNMFNINKKNIINTDMVDTNDSFVLLLNLLKQLKGESGLNEGIDVLNKNLINIQEEFTNKFLMEYFSEMGGNEEMLFNNNVLTNGFKININTLDPHRNLFSDNINIRQNTFDSFLYSLIRNPKQDIQYIQNVIFNYDNQVGDITVKITDPKFKIKDFVNSFLRKTEKLNSKNIMYLVLDDMFNLSNKNEQQLKENLEINNILTNNIINVIDDSYYQFTREDIKFIENKITLKGDIYYGEPTVDGKLSLEDYNEVLNSPNTFNTSFLTLILNKVISFVLPKYKNIAKKNFYERFLLSYKNVLTSGLIMNTEMLFLYNLLFSLVNIGKIDLLNNNRDFFRCFAKGHMNNILKILFNLIKKEILKLVSTVLIMYSKDLIVKYRKILTSIKLF